VFQIPLPPLRERRADLMPLMAFLLQRGAERMGLARVPSLEPEVEELLMAYQWPGNVRELEHVIDRALILADRGQVSCADLPPQIVKDATPMLAAQPAEGVDGAWLASPGDSLRDQVRRFECTLISRAIRDADGDRRLAAQKLGMGLSSLYRKQEEFETLGLL
jgi:two-component system response regulator AtoC